MVRKGHRKSRNGCRECKRRHLKCGEERPTCEKCVFSQRECVYDKPAPRRSGTLTTQEQESAGPTPGKPAWTHDGLLTPPCLPGVSPLPTELNVDHIELFHHFVTDTSNTIARTKEQIDLYREALLTHAFRNHHLMCQLVAVSALHMSLQRPQLAAHYRRTAAALQTEALTGFNQILAKVDRSNCLDILLFQHLIALQVFCDIFTSVESDFNEFLERLIGCVRLLRGVNTVIRTWWDVLRKTGLGLIMTQSDEHQSQQKASAEECLRLRDMIDAADLSAASVKVCHDSLDNLQRHFDSENWLGGEGLASTNMIFAWLVTASSEFTELLDQRRPEALVLLAHYAVLLHRRRQSWAIGDAGARLLVHINVYLGKRWEDWLAPANAMIAQCEPPSFTLLPHLDLDFLLPSRPNFAEKQAGEEKSKADICWQAAEAKLQAKTDENSDIKESLHDIDDTPSEETDLESLEKTVSGHRPGSLSPSNSVRILEYQSDRSLVFPTSGRRRQDQ